MCSIQQHILKETWVRAFEQVFLFLSYRDVTQRSVYLLKDTKLEVQSLDSTELILQILKFEMQKYAMPFPMGHILGPGNTASTLVMGSEASGVSLPKALL